VKQEILLKNILNHLSIRTFKKTVSKKKNKLKIIVSKLPSSPWWGKGAPFYEDNPCMVKGAIPNQSLLISERKRMIEVLKAFSVHIFESTFPVQLDEKFLKHDFIFIRDQFITDQNGNAVILNFRNNERKIEKKYIIPILESLELSIKYLKNKSGLYAEGGEFYFCKKDNILFSGSSRNSLLGIDEVATQLSVTEVIVLESNVFHLDAYFCPILDKDGKICAIICCLKLLTKKSKIMLSNFANKKNIPILEVPVEDSIGTEKKPGSLAVNALSLPGVLINTNTFSDKKVHKKLNKLGIKHVVTPLSQYALSGGAIHCCTNEI
tara:strand:- start:64705 stop:65670 length:966 start_codon:yes stop_codon:yes gene_type:complete